MEHFNRIQNSTSIIERSINSSGSRAYRKQYTEIFVNIVPFLYKLLNKLFALVSFCSKNFYTLKLF
jgi:hypothetical protein